MFLPRLCTVFPIVVSRYTNVIGRFCYAEGMQQAIGFVQQSESFGFRPNFVFTCLAYWISRTRVLLNSSCRSFTRRGLQDGYPFFKSGNRWSCSNKEEMLAWALDDPAYGWFSASVYAPGQTR